MTTQDEHPAAHRLATDGTDRRAWTEAEALERDRRAEERTRPVTAELVRNRGTRETVVWLLDESGTLCATAHVIRLDIRHDVRQDDAEAAASRALVKAGFRPVLGWTWTEVGAEASRRRWRIAIEPTADYLSYLERRYGPRPEIPAIDGATVTARTTRGWWDVTTSDGERYALTWEPQIGGDRWTVWGGENFTRLVRSTTDQAKALFVLRHPSHARV